MTLRVLAGALLLGAAWVSGTEAASENPAATTSPCTYALGAAGASLGVNGGTGSVNVTTAAGCGWTSASNAAWVTITSGTNRTGGGAVNFSVASNPTASIRTGTLAIAGKTFTVTEAACTFSIGAASSTLFPVTGGTGSVAVTTGNACAWTNTSGATWVTIASGTNRTGSGSVNYSVAANTTGGTRTVQLGIAGKSYTVSEAACTYTLGAPGASFTTAGGPGSVSVTTTGSCGWTSASGVPWVPITSAASRSGNGTVTFTVAPNTTASTRNGTLTIAGKPYTVTQTAAATTADLRVSFPSPGDSFTGKVAPAPVTVTNLGSQPSGGFDVGIFISPTSTPQSGQLLRTAHVSQLNPGATVSLNLDPTLPNNLTPGQYYMSVVADIGNTAAEPHTPRRAAVNGPFRVGTGVGGKFHDVSASVRFSTTSIRGMTPEATACSALGAVSLTGSATVTNQTLNPDNSVTATGTVTLSDPSRPATVWSGTFTANVDAQDRASISLTFTSVSLPNFSGTGQATATGVLTFSGGVGPGGLAGGGLGFAFVSNSGGFTGSVASGGGACSFSGDFRASVDLVFQLVFLHTLQAGGFTTSMMPAVNFPVPFSSFEPVLVAIDQPNTLPAPGAVTFSGPAGSGLTGQTADPSFSLLDQADGFGAYLGPLRLSSTPAPDGTYTVGYKGPRTFNVAIDAAHRAVVPFPTVTLDAGRNLTRVAWQYRDRQSGAPIAPPAFIGLIGVLIVTSDGHVCLSDFFDRAQTTFTVTPSAFCATPLRWDNVFLLDFLYVDTLSEGAYDVSFAGPRQSFPQLAVGVVGPGTVTSSPAGISSCSSTCVAGFARGTSVTLTAKPGSGAMFTGWTGACSGSSSLTCSVTMTSDTAVAAAFSTIPSQIRFLNHTCVGDGAGGCAGSYSITLTTSNYEPHAWVSSTGVASPYQPVFSPRLNTFDAFLGPPYTNVPYSHVRFTTGDIFFTPGRRYQLRFDVNNPAPACNVITPPPGIPNFCLVISDTTNSPTGSGVVVHQAPVAVSGAGASTFEALDAPPPPAPASR